MLVPTNRYIKQLNSVYMRVLRRIANACRFGHGKTDYEVRLQLGVPSVDCILMRARLRYFKRIAMTKPVSLMALLASRPGGKMLPWVSLIVDDLDTMRKRTSMCSQLPDPRLDPNAWWCMMRQRPNDWYNAINSLLFSQSVMDQRIATASNDGDRLPCIVSLYACNVCLRSFPSSRALKSDARAKHGQRAPQKHFADADGICVACGCVFHTRLRLLAHLANNRPNGCWNTIVSSPARFKRLSDETVRQLDLKDRESQREARRSGRSHPLAIGPAINAEGKVIGHARR